MKIFEYSKKKPEEICCVAMWELFVKLHDLDDKYICINDKTRKTEYNEEGLYHIEKLEMFRDENRAYYSSGLEEISSTREGITIYVKRIENKKIVREKISVRVNALCEGNKSMQEILDEHKLRFPTKEEMQDNEFLDEIPVVNYPKPIMLNRSQRTKNSIMESFAGYLKRNNIWYESDVDIECPRYTMIYETENAPNRCVESCIWFFDDAAEARVYYSSLGAQICKNSNHKDKLLRLLNYINATVFLNCSDGERGLYNPHMLYTPRIYVTEDGCFDIVITTIINYDFWKVAPVETADYLTAYCPELLDKLTAPIYGVLLGKIEVEAAIQYIKDNILLF